MSLKLRRRAVLAGAATATILPIQAVRAQAAWKPTSGVRIIVPAAPASTARRRSFSDIGRSLEASLICWAP